MAIDRALRGVLRALSHVRASRMPPTASREPAGPSCALRHRFTSRLSRRRANHYRIQYCSPPGDPGRAPRCRRIGKLHGAITCIRPCCFAGVASWPRSTNSKELHRRFRLQRPVALLPAPVQAKSSSRLVASPLTTISAARQISRRPPFVDIFRGQYRCQRGADADVRRIPPSMTPFEHQYLYPEFVLFRPLFRRHGINASITAPKRSNSAAGVFLHEVCRSISFPTSSPTRLE